MDDRLLARYVTGHCDARERRRVQRWLSQAPEHRRRAEQLQALWQHGRIERAPEASEHAWAHLKRRMRSARLEGARSDQARRLASAPPPRHQAASRKRQAPGAASRRGASRPVRRRFPSRALALAAAVLVAVAAGLFGLRQAGVHGFPSGPSVAPDTARTAPGERKRLRLADGTTVHLAPASELRFPPAFSDTARAVHLRGQAFFDVARDAARPFSVRTGEAQVRVLGTSFGVSAYVAAPEAVRVDVREGRVALAPVVSAKANAAQPGALVLCKGQTGRLTSAGRLHAHATSGAPLAWLDGRLAFRDAPFAHALRQLERWYAFEAVLADPGLAERRLTATFAGESLAEVLGLLRLSLQLRIERDGQTVTFYDASSQPSR